MNINTIHLDRDEFVESIERELVSAFDDAAMLGLQCKLLSTPAEFLQATQFLESQRSRQRNPNVSNEVMHSSAAVVERHVLIPGFRKIGISAGERLVGISSLLPEGPLSLPVEAFLNLSGVDLVDSRDGKTKALPRKPMRWAEVVNTSISNEIGSLEHALAAIIAICWFELAVNQTGISGFIFAQEPTCLIQLLRRAKIEKETVCRAGGPVWAVLPPKELHLRKFLATIREIFVGTGIFLSPDTLDGLIRFRPSIIETLPPNKLTEIAKLYPRQSEYQRIFAPDFLQSLKQTERYRTQFSARIEWPNGFSIQAKALDISESGIRLRSDSKVIPKDALREVVLSLQVDALQSITFNCQIRRISDDGLECGVTVDTGSAHFKYLVDWLKRSPFVEKTKN